MATAPAPSQQEATKFSQICDKCKVPTAIIEDHRQGDLICTECGLVLESRVIDESSEWRTFSDSDKGGADPSRTAGPTNRMLSNGGLGTSIGKNPDGTYNQTLTRLHNSGRNPDRPMLAAFSKINELADHLGMTSVVKDGACDIFRMVVKPGQPMLGKSLNAMYAACLYISCRQEGTNRTFKEICGGATGTTVKEIGKCYKHVVKAIDGLNTQMMEQMITPEKLVNRFSGNLGLANLEFLKLATFVVQKFRQLRDSEGHTSEKQPASVRVGRFPNPGTVYGPSLSTRPSLKGSILHTAQTHCSARLRPTVCPLYINRPIQYTRD
jgi:transcription initiation factor TFIIB|tara:strand:- start:3344 stop:4315 length:972 start_codon:yes stop_codon:yes gene_type:complete